MEIASLRGKVNLVLEELPRRFTIRDIAKVAAAKETLALYLRQIAVRWRKQGKTKRIGRGKYRKA